MDHVRLIAERIAERTRREVVARREARRSKRWLEQKIQIQVWKDFYEANRSETRKSSTTEPAIAGGSELRLRLEEEYSLLARALGDLALLDGQAVLTDDEEPGWLGF